MAHNFPFASFMVDKPASLRCALCTGAMRVCIDMHCRVTEGTANRNATELAPEARAPVPRILFFLRQRYAQKEVFC